MYAREIDDAAQRLRHLQHDEVANYGLAAAAFVLSFLAGAAGSAFAIPLLLAGVVAAARATHAGWSRWDLLDRLSVESDAHGIRAVRAHAARSATMRRRRSLATSIRLLLSSSDPYRAGRAAAAASELHALARELEDEELELHPAAAAACERLVTDSLASPLLNSSLPVDGVRSAVQRIRAGFHPVAVDQRPLRRSHA